MPKSTVNNTSNKATNSVANSSNISTEKDYSKEIESLKKSNEDLSAKLEQLMNVMSSMAQNKQSEVSNEEKKVSNKDTKEDVKIGYSYEDTPNEVNPNKQISVMSLSYGSLNLSEEYGGRAVLKFSRYGETKPVLYSKLMNIVNTNRRFAETGRFYILDKDAVYHLGLSENYKNILPKEIIDDIVSYSPNVIESIVSMADEYQKNTIARIICDKVFNNEDIDLNKVNLISKACNIDIMAKVDEMRSFSNQGT